jgi:hypothetical protein
MKIDCHCCHARYQIPDERVVGRVLKIRCKRCSDVMEVVGPTAITPGQEDPPSLAQVRPFIPGLNMPLVTAPPVQLEQHPVWWAAIAGRPHGPYTQGEVLALVDRGDVHARTRLWRPPWREWERVCECAALRWAYEAVVDRVGRDVAALDAHQGSTDVFAAAGLVTDGESYFPDPTMKSGWVILDEETQRYLETCARRGWALEPDGEAAAKEPVIIGRDMTPMGTTAQHDSLLPAMAAAGFAAVSAIAGAAMLMEGPLRLLLT